MSIPDLEERFLQPENWEWHCFERNGRQLRFGCAFPENSPEAVIVCLPGLSEFCEKYYETARDMLGKGYAFYVLDWMGQGKSSRYLPNPHKRHSEGFGKDVDDLHEWITAHIQPANKTNAPLVMLAHSMGANIGSHYLCKHPDTFACAAFSAPMYGMKSFEETPAPIRALLPLVNMLMGTRYAPGARDWSPGIRDALGHDHFSSDPLRNALHNQWCIADEELRVGQITYGWIYHANIACKTVQLRHIKTPCLIASAGKEGIVENKDIAGAAEQIPNATHIILDGANHEILMEVDEIRNIFLEGFYKLIKGTNIAG